jgi:hypothetical protein
MRDNTRHMRIFKLDLLAKEQIMSVEKLFCLQKRLYMRCNITTKLQKSSENFFGFCLTELYDAAAGQDGRSLNIRVDATVKFSNSRNICCGASVFQSHNLSTALQSRHLQNPTKPSPRNFSFDFCSVSAVNFQIACILLIKWITL